MQCPAWLRDAIGRLPFGMHIDGRTRVHLLRCLDVLFERSTTDVILPHGRLSIDAACDNERIVWYFARNMLRHARRTPLFRVMSALLPDREGAFVDVGANLGIYSYLARTLGADTILVEPEPGHFNFLSRNTSVFGPVYPYAVSDTCGRAQLHVGDLCHSGASSLVQADDPGVDSPYGSDVQVECMTFDRLLDHSGLSDSSISLIKIDVEGHERAVVGGMSAYFGRGGKSPIWCEVRGPESDRGGNTCECVVDFLADYSYRPFRMKNGHCVPFKTEAGADLPRVFDLLFLRDVDDVWRLGAESP